MSRRNRYKRAKFANKAAAPAAPAPDAIDRRAALRAALEVAKTFADARTPSMKLAQAYEVDPANYSRGERDAATHALDFNGDTRNALTFTQNSGFPGFPSLVLLGQLPEYRSMHERFADECTRKWGRVVSSGGALEQEQLAQIEDELKRLNVRGLIRTAVIQEQAYGRAHLYFKLKNDDAPAIRTSPLVPKKYSVPKGALEGLRPVEAYWVTPNNYNSSDPTRADFYKPSTWWMLGTEVHASRLYTLISRPVGDMLKPAYSFAGISMTQLAMPYVDNWLRSRQSVSDTLKQFSVSGVQADMQQMLLPGGAQDLAARAQLINAYRDNRNILFLDKATEEFFQVNTPLSGLDALQAQAQEQMSAVCHIPIVVLLGITPTGLNASSEGEIRVFYDYVKGYQTNCLMDLMQCILQLVQLSLFGQVDPSVAWEWFPLMELNALEAAEARTKDADTAAKYIEAGVITPDIETARLKADPNSIYAGAFDEVAPLDQVADDDIPGITEQILKIGTNDDPTASAGQEGRDPAADQPEQSIGTVVPGSDPEGGREHAGELRMVDREQVPQGA
jgi:phage-related protein (TIGR01555 family)